MNSTVSHRFPPRSGRQNRVVLILFLLGLLCASCAGPHARNDFEPQIHVKGQYDVSFGVTR